MADRENVAELSLNAALMGLGVLEQTGVLSGQESRRVSSYLQSKVRMATAEDGDLLELWTKEDEGGPSTASPATGSGLPSISEPANPTFSSFPSGMPPQTGERPSTSSGKGPVETENAKEWHEMDGQPATSSTRKAVVEEDLGTGPATEEPRGRARKGKEKMWDHVLPPDPSKGTAHAYTDKEEGPGPLGLRSNMPYGPSGAGYWYAGDPETHSPQFQFQDTHWPPSFPARSSPAANPDAAPRPKAVGPSKSGPYASRPQQQQQPHEKQRRSFICPYWLTPGVCCGKDRRQGGPDRCEFHHELVRGLPRENLMCAFWHRWGACTTPTCRFEHHECGHGQVMPMPGERRGNQGLAILLGSDYQ